MKWNGMRVEMVESAPPNSNQHCKWISFNSPAYLINMALKERVREFKFLDSLDSREEFVVACVRACERACKCHLDKQERPLISQASRQVEHPHRYSHSFILSTSTITQFSASLTRVLWLVCGLLLLVLGAGLERLLLFSFLILSHIHMDGTIEMRRRRSWNLKRRE